MGKTAFIYNDPHPAHAAFADAIGADFYPLLPDKATPSNNSVIRLLEYVHAPTSYPRNYDYYLIEGGKTLLSGAVFKLLHRDAKVVLLNADETFINVVEGLDHYGRVDGQLHRLASRQLDGMISVGEFIDDYAKRAGVSVPSEVVYPPIDDSLFDSLGNVTPSLESKTIVSVGVGKPAVGFDILVEAFSKVKEEHPEAKLHIAGKGHDKQWNKLDGVTVHGWVDDLAEFLAKGSLSVHPGRSECFPVSTLEPLRGGIPTIVSEMVGTKSVMREIDTHLVTAVSVDATADAISWYFDLDLEEKQNLSEECRARSIQFSEESCRKRFKTKFAEIIPQV